jgi:hypothetical protein
MKTTFGFCCCALAGVAKAADTAGSEAKLKVRVRRVMPDVRLSVFILVPPLMRCNKNPFT